MIASAAAFILLAGAALLFIWQASRRSSTIASADMSHDVALLRQAKADLDAAIARGDMSDADARAERGDLRRRALALEKLEARAAPLQAGKTGTALAALAALMSVAGAGYLWVSGPLGEPAQDSVRIAAPPRGPVPTGDFDALMAEGQQRFEAGNYRGSFDAYAAAAKQSPQRLEPWLAQGEALVAAQLGQVSPAAMLAFAEAERRSPGNPISQYYAGLERLQQGDPATARQIWLSLRRRSRPSAPWLAQVERGLAEAASQLGIEDEERPTVSPQQIEAMVAGLAARLEEDGDDPEGWLMLARSYSVLGRPDDARTALARLGDLADVPEQIQQQAAAIAQSLPPVK